MISVRDRVWGFIQRKREVSQEELLYINTEFEVERKQKIHRDNLLRILDELEEEGHIKRRILKIGNKQVTLIATKEETQ